MKKFFFIWLFIPFISFCQNDNEFKLQNVSQKNRNDFCISKMDCFYIENTIDEFDEVGMFYYILYYSYGESENKQAVDSIDDSSLLYDSLYSFKSQKDNSHVVFWEIGGEYGPSFFTYYIRDGKLTKIGKWIMVEPCDTCDYFGYSLNDIKILQRDNDIEFLFLKETEFIVERESFKYDNWGVFKAGELIVSFNTVDGTVKRVEKRE